MLEKKKKNRPLIIDLIEYFTTSVVGNFNIKLGSDDFESYQKYSEFCKKAYDKKRLIEGNQINIKNDFTALKRRVLT